MTELWEAQRKKRLHLRNTTAKNRISWLKQLKKEILQNQKEIYQALKKDLGKPEVETELTEIFTVIQEIKHSIQNLSAWMRPEKIATPIAFIGADSEIRIEPKGCVLILSPWNYPFQLSILPLIQALSAGNTVVLKPSEHAPETAKILQKICEACFAHDHVAVVLGDVQVAKELLALKWDHIFFTGSSEIGKSIMADASKHLSSVTLELGGKSPVIIDESADIPLAAERISWGKFMNAGQTCVAPDYLLVDEKIYDAFLKELKNSIHKFYGSKTEERAKSKSYARLIHERHLKRMQSLFEEAINEGAQCFLGGESDASQKYFEPTVLTHIDWHFKIMEDEIFGPILPVIKMKSHQSSLDKINEREKPLALYIFSRDQKKIDYWLQNTSAGGSCINQIAAHLANPDLPFGGTGYSGIGSYHGKHGFLEFSHQRSVMRVPKWGSSQFLLPPYEGKSEKFVKAIQKLLY